MLIATVFYVRGYLLSNICEQYILSVELYRDVIPR
jgi:hypothetical protein